MNSENSRRGFLKFLLGIPFGVPVVRKLYGQSGKSKHLLLNIFSIAGYQFHDGESVENQLKPGDVLKLNADPSNPHDEFAVEILTDEGVKLGFVPRSDNKAISRLLRQGANVEARIESLDLEEVSWQRVRVGVRLVI
jgi:hypothetical protein